MKRPPLKLEPFHGPPRGFSFTKEIQPILDRHCVRCHNHRDPLLALARGEGEPLLEQSAESRSPGRERAFSLLGEKIRDEHAGRDWSDAYLVLTQAKRDGRKGDDGPFRGRPDGSIVKWISSQSVPTPLPPEFAGSTRSALLDLLEKGHYDVTLTREDYEKIACWIDLLVPFCGDYTEANAWTPAEMDKYNIYQEKRRLMDQLELDAVKAWNSSR